MDPYAKRLLEKAEQRSRALGISANGAEGKIVASPTPLQSPSKKQSRQEVRPQAPRSPALSSRTNNSGSTNKLQVVEKVPVAMESSVASSVPAAGKVLRQFAAVDKENRDLGIEINIMTDVTTDVQVEVEEKDITDSDTHTGDNEAVHQPIAKIRDSSRNRLQRLGALYSNTNDLSSPIHRTEGQFHADSMDTNILESSPRRPRQRYGKLATLANTINQWEDDTTQHLAHPPKPDLPTRRVEGAAKKQIAPGDGDVPESSSSNDSKTKQLKWDSKVINALEAQGFQRRESSTVKVSYDYNNKEEDKVEETPTQAPVRKLSEERGRAGNENGVAAQTTTTTSTNNNNRPEVKAGLVSGRAAAFESISAASSANAPSQRPQKDPTELSLRERMQLFEKNKGEALVPKAALGMAPPISKLRQPEHEPATKRDEIKAHLLGLSHSGSAISVKSSADSKVRDKVAALVANATLSENKIRADIQKQRQEDMEVLANRFNHQKKVFTEGQEHRDRDGHTGALSSKSQVKATAAALMSTASAARPPPPPPPPPQAVWKDSTAATESSHKRRSPGDAIDEESKRARKSNAQTAHRLYPALSDFESNESSAEEHCCTTATVSATGRSTVDDSERDVENDNESYMDSDGDGVGDGSLGREVMQMVCQNVESHVDANAKRSVRYASKDLYYAAGCDSSLNSSDLSMGVDDYLDEALDDGDDDCTQESDEGENSTNNSRTSRGSKGTTSSNSFSFRKTPGKYAGCQPISEEADNFQTPLSALPGHREPVTSQLSVNREEDNMVTLVHTVSFYRRQQNSANSTPVRKICREQQVLRSALENGAAAALYDGQHRRRQYHCDSSSDTSTDADEARAEEEQDDAVVVQEKIKKLLDEVCKQQQIIGQTSQALNLCAATIEFSGSAESVEGERHLLVATHRRQVCLDEVQRLRVEKTLRPVGSPKERGRLSVRDITLPLSEGYIHKLATDKVSGHHLVCLLKYNEHVLATKTVPTLPGLRSVQFPDVLQLDDVYADFRVTLEVYGMTAQREILPHEVKYHINLHKKSGVKTPKKKGADNRLVMPPVQSPAGPNVVRTPALVQYGFAIFSLREIQQTKWTLSNCSQVHNVCPLAGLVSMKVNCELSVSVEYSGFLTMYGDISGFGAWHRRWCQLNGSVINYWKYPDDEKKRAPMGSIDLYSCVSPKVTIAPRDICSRWNTMLVECERPAKDSDVESITIVPNGRITVVRHLLAADTKEDLDEWCAYINKALTLLRAWGPPAQ